VSWGYLFGALEILNGCPRDIYSVSWRYLNGVLEILIRFFRYFIGDLETFAGVLKIFDGCHRDI